MEIILNKNKLNAIWEKIYNEYGFSPSIEIPQEKWLTLSEPNKGYFLNSFWTEEQETIIRGILHDTVFTEMYALDWEHDCFIFNPSEDIPYGFYYYDSLRGANVYFPSYYPDGDYYFFVSTDWRYGLFGHPWRKEIIVMGEVLIEQFDLHKAELDLKAI